MKFPPFPPFPPASSSTAPCGSPRAIRELNYSKGEMIELSEVIFQQAMLVKETPSAMSEVYRT